jgi:hypothetical protein
MSIETMILRFRDLSTNVGETIRFHQARINERGYAWWGWWHKAGETIPSGTFQALMSIIDKEGCLAVFLFDTGTGTLYPAKIDEIRWDSRFQEIESPSWDATPDYYEGRKLKAWFKLTDIGNGIKDDAVLREWSYVEVDELFVTKKSIFQDFNGKQVSSCEELRHQEKTIWFIRHFKPGDAIREILLYDTSRVQPSDFPENIIESHSARLLWLSDLHFSTDHHAFPSTEGVQSGNKLAEAIRKDLDAQGFQEIGGIVLTGDLTWRASKEEFTLVRSFLDDIMSWSTLTPNQIVLCPGNHDIAFSDKPWEKGALVTEATGESKKNFEQFYSELFSVAPNLYLASGRRFLLARSFVLEIASFNSSYLRQTKDVFQGQGFVGDGQRDLVAKEMSWRESDGSAPRPFRVVLLHHHLVPVIPDELAVYDQQSSLVYDAGALCNWVVKHRVNLVLHGHMHHTKVVREARSLGLVEGNTQWHEFTVASLGSTGVDLSHNQLDRRNVYGLLEFSNKSVRLRIREIHPKDPDRSVDPTIVNVEIPYEKSAYAI